MKNMKLMKKKSHINIKNNKILLFYQSLTLYFKQNNIS